MVRRHESGNSSPDTGSVKAPSRRKNRSSSATRPLLIADSQTASVPAVRKKRSNQDRPPAPAPVAVMFGYGDRVTISDSHHDRPGEIGTLKEPESQFNDVTRQIERYWAVAISATDLVMVEESFLTLVGDDPDDWEEGDLVEGESFYIPGRIVQGYDCGIWGTTTIRIFTGQGWHPIKKEGAKRLQVKAFKPQPCPDCGEPLVFPRGNWQHCSKCSNALPIGKDSDPSPIESLQTIEPAKKATELEILAAEICQLWGEAEQAVEVAARAELSGLETARLCGEKLQEAKAKCRHGEWEKFRDTHIRHPSNNKPIPQATAALYQRVALRWPELVAQGVKSLREADRALRRLPSSGKDEAIGPGDRSGGSAENLGGKPGRIEPGSDSPEMGAQTGKDQEPAVDSSTERTSLFTDSGRAASLESEAKPMTPAESLKNVWDAIAQSPITPAAISPALAPDEKPVVRLKTSRKRLKELKNSVSQEIGFEALQSVLDGAIVQIGDMTYVLKADDIRVEVMK